MNDNIKINENERKVLETLVHRNSETGEIAYMYFRNIAAETKLELKQVSRACRSLRKKGLAEFMRGLFSDDGMAAGSGYGATPEGEKFIGNKLPL